MPSIDHHPIRRPVRTLVVDDEPLARRNLTILLGRDPDIGSIMECGGGAEAIGIIRQSRPDLVFLDVQMPECGGFDVLEALGADVPQTLIFVTAFDEYALRAFEVGALDYLLKPFNDERFHSVLARAKEKIARYGVQNRPAGRFIVKSPGQILFVDVADIDWVEAAGYYACLHVGDATHVIRRSLAELEQELGPDRFIRIHRSAVVNIDRMRAIELQRSGDYEVVLENGRRLPLSRRCRKQVQDRATALVMGLGPD
ncbi:LytR/AlgR family response regulator transcription factor [Sphingomonas sp.]|uniref:LytR/AlgR family response regulator transcription factor n=1 Tax=Sphingomonas sp. TaxID=28214 RepID=UPI003D6D7094